MIWCIQLHHQYDGVWLGGGWLGKTYLGQVSLGTFAVGGDGSLWPTNAQLFRFHPYFWRSKTHTIKKTVSFPPNKEIKHKNKWTTFTNVLVWTWFGGGGDCGGGGGEESGGIGWG